MDNSSRNIVKFIITITVAALLIMGARYYAESQKEPVPEIAEKASATDNPTVETPPEDALADTAANPDTISVDEQPEVIMGEPSMNVEQGGLPDYVPPELPEPQPPIQAPVEK